MIPRCPLTPDEDGDIDEDAIGEWFAALCQKTIEAARNRTVSTMTDENFEKIEVTTMGDVARQWIKGKRVGESVSIIFRC